MTSREEAAARNRARVAIFDGLDSASLDELNLVSSFVARLAARSESANIGGSTANRGAPTVCADTHHVAESALRPHGDGAAPTYECRPPSEALTDAERRLRADTILDVMRGLQDRASLAEIIVMQRCLQRLEIIRREPPREPGDRPCGLDDALRLELTDVLLERALEQGEAHGEAAKAWLAEEVDSFDACPNPFGHEWMARGPILECRLCGAAQQQASQHEAAPLETPGAA